MKKIPVRKLVEAQNSRGALERFNIRSVQQITGGQELNHDLHRHDFFFILALKKGKGVHEIDFNEYELRDNSIFFLRPGQVHQLILKAGCEGYLMEFNNEFYHPNNSPSTPHLRKASSKNFCTLESSRFEKIDSLLGFVLEEYDQKIQGYQDVIKAQLDVLFIELIRHSQNPGTVVNSGGTYSQERLEEFLELLEKNITDHKQVTFYTDQMNLSAYQLNEITKATLGKTASVQINEQIILEAKRHLIATPNQIKDIAFHLGYEDISYFIRFFKKHTGQSPEAFRKNFR